MKEKVYRDRSHNHDAILMVQKNLIFPVQFARTRQPPEGIPPPALQLAHGRPHPLLQNGQSRALQSGGCSRSNRADEDGVISLML